MIAGAAAWRFSARQRHADQPADAARTTVMAMSASSHATSYDMMERRGDAQPFDYGVFALTLGRNPAEDEPVFSDRCGSNERGLADFDAALSAAKALTESERATLSNARRAMQPDCGEGSDMRALVAEAVSSVNIGHRQGFCRLSARRCCLLRRRFCDALSRCSKALANAPAAWPKELRSICSVGSG